MKKLTLLLFACAGVHAATLFISAYPHEVLVFDEAKGQVVETITLSTGLPTGMRLSQDRKKIYVITNDNSGVETIDVATRKVDDDVRAVDLSLPRTEVHTVPSCDAPRANRRLST